jgi:hypothetical protein
MAWGLSCEEGIDKVQRRDVYFLTCVFIILVSARLLPTLFLFSPNGLCFVIPFILPCTSLCRFILHWEKDCVEIWTFISNNSPFLGSLVGSIVYFGYLYFQYLSQWPPISPMLVSQFLSAVLSGLQTFFIGFTAITIGIIRRGRSS